MPSSSAARPWRMPLIVVSPATTLAPLSDDRMAKRACSGVAPGASSTRKPLTLPGASTAGGAAAVAANHAGQGLERGERHEHAALMGADAGAAEPAIDGVRLAEDQELRAERRVAAGAQDHVAGLQWPIDASRRATAGW